MLLRCLVILFFTLVSFLFLNLQMTRAEFKPSVEAYIPRCVLVVKCSVEIEKGILNYRVVETWKGQYRSDLFSIKPREGYLYSYGQNLKQFPTDWKAGQEVILFFSDNALTMEKDGTRKIRAHSPDDTLPVVDGKILWDRNLEMPMGKFYTVAELKQAVLKASCAKDEKQHPNQKTPTEDSEFVKQWKAIPVPAKTPFDGDEMKKTDYLRCYRDGFLWAKGAHLWCPTNPSEHNLHAIRGWVEGWQAGVKAGGQSDLPARYGPYLMWKNDDAK